MKYGTIICFVLGGLVFTTAPSMTVVHAKAMTSSECGALRQQRQVFEKKGVGNFVLKGAKWATSNLNADQINEVGSFLKVLENIRFRCGKAVTNRKSKVALHKVPLPARNSRRLKRIRAKKAQQKTSPVTLNNIAPETKSVISAVTNGKEQKQDGTTTGTPSPSYRPPAN